MNLRPTGVPLKGDADLTGDILSQIELSGLDFFFTAGFGAKRKSAWGFSRMSVFESSQYQMEGFISSPETNNKHLLIPIFLVRGCALCNRQRVLTTERALGETESLSSSSCLAYFSSSLRSFWGWGNRGWLLQTRRWWIPRPDRSPS